MLECQILAIGVASNASNLQFEVKVIRRGYFSVGHSFLAARVRFFFYGLALSPRFRNFCKMENRIETLLRISELVRD